MSPQYPPGSEGWRDAQDYLPPAQAEIAAERFRELQAENAEREKVWRQGLDKELEVTPPQKTDEQLAKERAEFKEMMQAKREAKQAARAAQEKAEVREAIRKWIATRWDGETPDHLKKALRTGDPKDLGMLIHEWRAFAVSSESQASDATFLKRLDFPLADQSAVVEAPPAGFVYFVRNGDLFKIGITENMLRRLRELAPDELLNVVRCSNFQEVERELHRRFKDVRLPQTEYFRLSDQQVQEVHQLMMKLAEFPSK